MRGTLFCARMIVKWCEERCRSFFCDLNLVNYILTLIPSIPLCETMQGTSFPCGERLFRVRNVTFVFPCFVSYNLFLLADVEPMELLFMIKGYVLGLIDELSQYPEYTTPLIQTADEERQTSCQKNKGLPLMKLPRKWTGLLSFLKEILLRSTLKGRNLLST